MDYRAGGDLGAAEPQVWVGPVDKAATGDQTDLGRVASARLIRSKLEQVGDGGVGKDVPGPVSATGQRHNHASEGP